MPSQRHITVRRAPKFFPFLVAGGLLGAIVAAIVGYTGTVPDGYSRESIFGYFLVLFVAAGVLVGGVVALVLDRVSVARAQKAIVEEVSDEDEPGDATAVEQADATAVARTETNSAARDETTSAEPRETTAAEQNEADDDDEQGPSAS